MLNQIHYIYLEEKNIHIAYGKEEQTLWLTPEGADLNDFSEFLISLCPTVDIEMLDVETALQLQKKLYDALQHRLRQTLNMELAKFGKCVERQTGFPPLRE